MNTRKNKSQQLGAAKAGISQRSARRIERSATLPSQNARRYWRSRADPFIDVWDTQIVPLLKSAPKLMAITLLRRMPSGDSVCANRDCANASDVHRNGTWLNEVAVHPR